MTTKGLNYISSLMERLNIPYEFMQWNSNVPSTYWIGEYNEVESMSENGMQESNFILTGTTNKKYLELETTKERLKKELGNGLTAMLDDNSGIAVLYSNSFPIPSVEYGVHRMQINLRIKEYRGE